MASPYTLERVTLAPLDVRTVATVIARWHAALPPGARGALVAESTFIPIEPPSDVPLLRVAAGCVCCTGQLVLRVELARLLRRHRPSEVLLLGARRDHLPSLASQLAAGAFGVAVVHIDTWPSTSA